MGFPFLRTLLASYIDMLENILQSLEEWDASADGPIVLTRLHYSGNEMAFDIRVPTRHSDRAACWEVTCSGISDFSLLNKDIVECRLKREHPLLWPHLRSRSALYVARTGTDISSLVKDLYDAHVDVVGDWFSFRTFINTDRSLTDLLKSGAGFFAEGPDLLIERYAAVMQRYDIEVTIIDTSESAPSGAVDKPVALQVLLLGSSYIIAESFQELKKS